MHNASTYLLANVASKLIPYQESSPNIFSIELIFRPSIPDNITNWRVFNNDSYIIYFLTSPRSYDSQILDENDYSILYALYKNVYIILYTLIGIDIYLNFIRMYQLLLFNKISSNRYSVLL